MRLSSVLKTAGFVVGCLVWLVAALTLLGPRISTPIQSTVFLGPVQPLDTLTCPGWLGASQEGTIVGRFTNHTGKALTYHVVTEFPYSNDLPGCDQTGPVAGGETGSASCAITPANTGRITARMTAWAEGDSCENGCPNSYSSTCVIMPDPGTLIADPGWQTATLVILSLELILIALALAMWRGVGRASRIVMAIFFSASALILVYGLYGEYHNWLASALLAGLLLAAIGVAALWLRAHPARSTQ